MLVAVSAEVEERINAVVLELESSTSHHHVS